MTTECGASLDEDTRGFFTNIYTKLSEEDWDSAQRFWKSLSAIIAESDRLRDTNADLLAACKALLVQIPAGGYSIEQAAAVNAAEAAIDNAKAQ